MSDLNNYTFTGRVGKDAEVSYAQSGTAVWKANVAVGYGYGDNKGTNWINVAVFGKRAESLGKLAITKGSHIGVTGELRIREYDDKSGNKRTSVELIANDVALLGGKPETSRQDKPSPRSEPRSDDAFPEDEIPF